MKYLATRSRLLFVYITRGSVNNPWFWFRQILTENYNKSRPKNLTIWVTLIYTSSSKKQLTKTRSKQHTTVKKRSRTPLHIVEVDCPALAWLFEVLLHIYLWFLYILLLLSMYSLVCILRNATTLHKLKVILVIQGVNYSR